MSILTFCSKYYCIVFAGTNEGPQYDGIYACIDLPSLSLGTVGGGTALATQKELLNLMGCYGKVKCSVC